MKCTFLFYAKLMYSFINYNFSSILERDDMKFTEYKIFQESLKHKVWNLKGFLNLLNYLRRQAISYFHFHEYPERLSCNQDFDQNI